MERFLFEAKSMNDKQIQKLEYHLKNMEEVHNWEVKQDINGVILILEVLRLHPLQLARTLDNYGFPVERLYEE